MQGEVEVANERTSDVVDVECPASAAERESRRGRARKSRVTGVAEET